MTTSQPRAGCVRQLAVRSPVSAVAVVVLVALAAGCGSGSGSSAPASPAATATRTVTATRTAAQQTRTQQSPTQQATTRQTSPPQATTQQTTRSPGGTVTRQQARQAALAHVGEGRVTYISREDDFGATWEVEVTRPNGSEVDVYVAADGSVVHTS